MYSLLDVRLWCEPDMERLRRPAKSVENDPEADVYDEQGKPSVNDRKNGKPLGVSSQHSDQVIDLFNRQRQPSSIKSFFLCVFAKVNIELLA
jgi:hypothetical protein